MTDIQGFVARDDHRKEIIVALRGRLVSNSKKWIRRTTFESNRNIEKRIPRQYPH